MVCKYLTLFLTLAAALVWLQRKQELHQRIEKCFT